MLSRFCANKLTDDKINILVTLLLLDFIMKLQLCTHSYGVNSATMAITVCFLLLFVVGLFNTSCFVTIITFVIPTCIIFFLLQKIFGRMLLLKRVRVLNNISNFGVNYPFKDPNLRLMKVQQGGPDFSDKDFYCCFYNSVSCVTVKSQ